MATHRQTNIKRPRQSPALPARTVGRGDQRPVHTVVAAITGEDRAGTNHADPGVRVTRIANRGRMIAAVFAISIVDARAPEELASAGPINALRGHSAGRDALHDALGIFSHVFTNHDAGFGPLARSLDLSHLH